MVKTQMVPYFGSQDLYLEAAEELSAHFWVIAKSENQLSLDKDGHPELDDTSLLEAPDIKIYQSLIGTLQWL